MPKGHVSETEAELCRQIFVHYDKDKNNHLDSDELGKFLRDLGEEMTPEEVTEAVKQLDKDNSGTIDFEEFLSWWSE